MNLLWKRWLIVVISLVATALYIELMPLREETALKKDLGLFPSKIGKWVHNKNAGMAEPDTSSAAENILSRSYRDGNGQTISLQIIYKGKFNHGDNIFKGTTLSPGKQWNVSEKLRKKVEVQAQTLTIDEIIFKRGNEYLLITYWYFMGSTGLTNKKSGRIKQAVNAILNQRTDVALIMVSSPSHLLMEDSNHQIRHARFIQTMTPALLDFLPYNL